jgi:glyoxylase-like metal-dependent hydrolase (beta-lactamase superfamily II)
MNIRWFLFLCALPTCAFLPVAATAADETPLEPVPLADNLLTFRGTMANSAVFVAPEGVLLIDAGDSPTAAARLQAAIAALTPQPVTLLVNTHWHFDHVNGNGAFARRGAVIIGQTAMRARAVVSDRGQGAGPLPERERPVVTFERELALRLGAETVRLVHPQVGRAHTDGDTVVIFSRANVVHMGDLYFEGMYPYIDVEAGGSAAGMAAAIRELLPLLNDQTKVVPGHGPVSDKQKLTAFADMLADISGRVQSLITAGKTLAAVQAAKPTAAYDEKWGHGFMKPDGFVELVYRGLGAR